MSRINLDMDVLRTLVTAHQLGSFNRAAEQIGRSQSAISQQIHKLEERLGQALFRKHGRGLALTEAGEVVLSYARRILDLNDEAVTAVMGAATDGAVRFGMPGDFAETWLPAALGKFKRAHPAVRIEAVVDRNKSLLERVDKGQLDLAIVLALEVRGNPHILGNIPMVWISRRETSHSRDEPVPLAVFEQPCFFRSAAIAALEQAARAWRIEFTSPSLAGLWAAVDAGLGVTARTAISVPSRMTTLRDDTSLPSLPPVKLCLYTGCTPGPETEHLRDIVLSTLPANMNARPEEQGGGRPI
jgi:DNA-binding transcriptional LysR family regulator